MGSELIFWRELLANRSSLGNLFRILSKMIIAFLTLLLMQYSFADDKEFRRTFGKEYKALDIGVVEGACQYTKSCLKCMKGFRMHEDQYCEPKSASSQARYAADMAGGEDPCQKRLGANHTAMYPGACMFKGCFLCLNGGEVGLGDDGLPACVLPAPADPPSKRRRRSVENSPVTEAPTTTETPLTRSASAPFSPNPYPQPPLHPQYPLPPHSLYPPSPYGYPKQPLGPLGGLFKDPMMLLLLSGGLGGSSDPFSTFLLLSQFGNLGGHGFPKFPSPPGYHPPPPPGGYHGKLPPPPPGYHGIPSY